MKTKGDKIGIALCVRLNLQTTMPTDNTSPILPPTSSIVAVWLCAKVRQLNRCRDICTFTLLCLYVVCVCSTMNAECFM